MSNSRSFMAHDEAWQIQSLISSVDGFAYGCQQPSVTFVLSGRPISPQGRTELWGTYRSHCETLPPSIPEPGEDSWEATVIWLFNAWQAVQVSVGLPVFEIGRVLSSNASQARCVVPTLSSTRTALAVLIKETIDYLGNPAATKRNRANHFIGRAITELRQFVPRSSNVAHFVQAAFDQRMPFREMPGGVYQFGIGAAASWLDSSFTDTTPFVAAKLAKNKWWSAALLREAGLPVPEHRLVTDAPSAVITAREFGYPVVIKPADRDGGVGVAAGLCTDDEVKEAYEIASKLSRNILVERHIPGRDYRITVFRGEAIWAIERIPAGIIGDGTHSVTELVFLTNSDPRRGMEHASPLRRLLLDKEARQLLEQQGYAEESIPPPGAYVRLKRAANIASGGTPVAAFDRLHPDNAQLAVRAANISRLDLAGIDLLIEDISVSWRQTGAAICEINGQPVLGQTTSVHLYAHLLKKLVPNAGRIPTILVFGAQHPDVWVQAISGALSGDVQTIGVAVNGKVCVGDEVILSDVPHLFEGGKILALDRRVNAIVLSVEDDSVLTTGLAISSCDAVILAGTYLRSKSPLAAINRKQWLAEMMRCMLPACDGVVVSPVSDGLKLQGLNAWTSAEWIELAGEPSTIAVETMHLLARRPKRFNPGPANYV